MKGRSLTYQNYQPKLKKKTYYKTTVKVSNTFIESIGQREKQAAFVKMEHAATGSGTCSKHGGVKSLKFEENTKPIIVLILNTIVKPIKNIKLSQRHSHIISAV